MSRLTTRVLGALTAAAAGVVAVSGSALALTATDVVVYGTASTVMVEWLPGVEGDETLTQVTVDDTLVSLPEDLLDRAEAEGLSGPVELTVSVRPGVGREAMLAALAADAGATARVTEVVPLGAQAEAAGVTLGQHTLTVVPVYGSATDGTSIDTFTGWAQGAAAYWSTQSGGRMSFSVDVRGWTPISWPTTCDQDLLYSRALEAAGISTVDSTHHVVVYFPQRSDCGWAGLASIGGGTVWVNGSTLSDVLAHELGHNFGLGHANTATCGSGTRTSLLLPITSCALSEYGDRSDVMGIAMAAPTGSLSSAMADFLGFANVVQVQPGQSVTVDLAPLADASDQPGVAITVPGGTVYVDFRPAVATDTRMRAWAGVQVHYRAMAGTFRPYPVTYLLDMKPSSPVPFSAPQLVAGGTWAVPGTSLVVTVTRVGSTATIQVTPPGAAAACPTPGAAGAMPVDSPMIFRGGYWFLRGSYSTGGADVCFPFGDPTDVPVTGDWDGDGTVTAGVFRAGVWYLRDSNGAGAPNLTVQYGSPGDVPVVGDWDGDGIDTVGVFRAGTWYLRNSNTSGAADVSFRYGSPGDVPVVGDWDNDDTDSLGVFRSGQWLLTNHPASGLAEGVFRYGQAGDVPVVGDWNRDGTDTLAVFRDGMWYLTNWFDRGVAEGWFGFGQRGDRPLLFR